MKGTGNGLATLFQKLYFYCLPTCLMRTNYVMRHKHLFHHLGDNIKWQPRHFPADPEFLSIGNNVKLAANVCFVNHDINSEMLNDMYGTNEFEKNQGCISIGNNVMIGSNVMILPNVRIGDNCIIGGGSIVTKDIPSNSIAAGVPCKVIGDFENFVNKARKIRYYTSPDKYWEIFDKEKSGL